MFGQQRRESDGKDKTAARKKLSPNHITTSESQYEAEMLRLRAKQLKRQRLNNSRRIAICGSKHERAEVQRSVKKKMDEIVDAKNKKEETEKNDDHVKINSAVTKEKEIFRNQEKKRSEKRESLRQMMEENKKLVEMKKQTQRQERLKEIERSKKEVEFFDRFKEYL